MMTDQSARKEALNVHESFIVQAPAGSGKTELLTQRYLALLGSASEQPEEILAITFTRKAAAQMRLRILNALQKAHNEPPPTAAHARETYQLAQRVLTQSEKLSWDLLHNPQRLRIQTIDALCNYIVKQMPIISRFGSHIAVKEDAHEFYLIAANRTLDLLEGDTLWSHALEYLLMHLDNNLGKLQALFIYMLKCRDQWLSHVINPNPRQHLEQSLQDVIETHLRELNALIPHPLLSELKEIAMFAQKNLAAQPSLNFNSFSLETWNFIADLFLTQDDQLRKTFTIKQGFPAGSVAKTSALKQQYTEMKIRALQLCDSLNRIDNFMDLFTEVRQLPDPIYSDTQWQMLEALITLLPILCAQLQLVFSEKNQVDFVEISIRALEALGHYDEVSELALQLDYKLRHILVDEFQDTSTLQFKLLEKLTRGWQNQDGKTLFLVGDPQQSIYRFRKADVGLFLQAQKQGVAALSLKSLHLSLNFRSNQQLIDWNNTLFSQVFPFTDNYLTGAITFKPAQAGTNSNVEQENIKMHLLPDEMTVNQTMVEIIQTTWTKNPNQSIAILVMARSHLNDVITELKQHHIPYRATEIDPLYKKSLIQDLYALTRAIVFPADRLAWLTLLRAPYCGLHLKDLEIIANTTTTETILERLQHYDTLPLSTDAKTRLPSFLTKINHALNVRGKFALHMIIHATWLALQAENCLSTDATADDVEQYLTLLADFEQGGDIPDIALFEYYLERLHSKEPNVTTHAVEIMTIHKAKGLEFDVVMLPGLHKKTLLDPHQLLLWQERTRATGQFDLLLAPIHSTLNQSDPNKIYTYLQKQEQKKIKNELIRLLYVALTRAKEKLHLLSIVTVDDYGIKNPLKGSMLSLMWDLIKDKGVSRQPSPPQSVATFQSNKLIRLKTPIQPETIVPLHSHKNTIMPMLHTTATPQKLGTVIHALLEKLQSDQQSLAPLLHYAKSLLIQSGIPTGELPNAMETCKQALLNIVADERGRWILNNHQNSQSEMSVSALFDDELHHLTIDKTFVADEIRWIIDFKTAQPYDEALADFFKEQHALYQAQLETYARALARLDKRPIKLGLYFPLIPAWYEWNYVRK